MTRLLSYRLFLAVLMVGAVAAVARPQTGPIQQGGAVPVQPSGERKLALLITVPTDNYFPNAAANDLSAMQQALRERGFKPSQILALSGGVKRQQVLSFLRDGGARAAQWSDGVVFLYYSGSGYWPKGNPPIASVKTGWELSSQADDFVLWDEVFAALNLPVGVRLVVLPDCCYSNTLADASFANAVPKNVSGIMLKAAPGETKCTADNFAFNINGKRTEHGIITYYATQALKTATTIENWVETTNALANADVARNVLPREKLVPLAPLGDGKLPLFSAP